MFFQSKFVPQKVKIAQIDGMESSEILSPLLNSVCKNQLKLQIDRIEGSVNSVTPSELSLQKSAQITNLYDI